MMSRAFSVRVLLPFLVLPVLAGCDFKLPGQAEKEPDYQAINANVVITPADLPHGAGPEMLGVKGLDPNESTLSWCGASYPSESLRMGRHQVAYPAGPALLVSSETVRYQAGGAAQAMDELRARVAACTKGFIHDKNFATRLYKLRIKTVGTDDAWEDDSVALEVRLSPRGKRPSRGMAIYQRRGDILVGIYAWTGGRGHIALARELSTLMAQRLDAAFDG